MTADARLDAAIALARRLATAPGAQGARIAVSAAWDSGVPDALHGDVSIHVDAATPASLWAVEIVPAEPEAYAMFTCEGRMIVSWRAEIEGARVTVYCASPLPETAEVKS